MQAQAVLPQFQLYAGEHDPIRQMSLVPPAAAAGPDEEPFWLQRNDPCLGVASPRYVALGVQELKANVDALSIRRDNAVLAALRLYHLHRLVVLLHQEDRVSRLVCGAPGKSGDAFGEDTARTRHLRHLVKQFLETWAAVAPVTLAAFDEAQLVLREAAGAVDEYAVDVVLTPSSCSWWHVSAEGRRGGGLLVLGVLCLVAGACLVFCGVADDSLDGRPAWAVPVAVTVGLLALLAAAALGTRLLGAGFDVTNAALRLQAAEAAFHSQVTLGAMSQPAPPSVLPPLPSAPDDPDVARPSSEPRPSPPPQPPLPDDEQLAPVPLPVTTVLQLGGQPDDAGTAHATVPRALLPWSLFHSTAVLIGVGVDGAANMPEAGGGACPSVLLWNAAAVDATMIAKDDALGRRLDAFVDEESLPDLSRMCRDAAVAPVGRADVQPETTVVFHNLRDGTVVVNLRCVQCAVVVPGLPVDTALLLLVGRVVDNGLLPPLQAVLSFKRDVLQSWLRAALESPAPTDVGHALDFADSQLSWDAVLKAAKGFDQWPATSLAAIGEALEDSADGVMLYTSTDANVRFKIHRSVLDGVHGLVKHLLQGTPTLAVHLGRVELLRTWSIRVAIAPMSGAQWSELRAAPEVLQMEREGCVALRYDTEDDGGTLACLAPFFADATDDGGSLVGLEGGPADEHLPMALSVLLYEPDPVYEFGLSRGLTKLHCAVVSVASASEAARVAGGAQHFHVVVAAEDPGTAAGRDGADVIAAVVKASGPFCVAVRTHAGQGGPGDLGLQTDGDLGPAPAPPGPPGPAGQLVSSVAPVGSASAGPPPWFDRSTLVRTTVGGDDHGQPPGSDIPRAYRLGKPARGSALRELTSVARRLEELRQGAESRKREAQELLHRHRQTWELGVLLGEGRFARVYEAQDKVTGGRFAIKIIDSRRANLEGLVEEIKVLDRLDHPNVVRYLYTHVEQDALHLCMELCEGGSLESSPLLAHGLPPLSHPGDDACTERLGAMAAVLKQLLGALEYIHARRVVHRDIKPGNILLTKDGTVRLSDFGVAFVKAHSDKAAVGTVGTVLYMAPEVLQGGAHDTPCDVYSVGVVALRLMHWVPTALREATVSGLPGILSFYERHHLVDLVEQDFDGPSYASVPQVKGIRRTAMSFVRACLVPNPEERPTAALLLQHPLMQLSP